MGYASVVSDRSAGRGEPRPPLLLHSLDVAAPEPRWRRVGATTTVSAAGHAALVACLLVLPLLTYDARPEPGARSTFFVAPLEIQPSPPPPPPPRAGIRPVPRPVPSTAPTDDAGLVLPIEMPSQIEPELGIDLGLPTGLHAGVEGGVPDGVPGGVVGGLPQPATDPAPKPQAVRVGGQIERPVKTKDVTPHYPQLALDAHVQGVVVLECTISPRGTVSDVKVLRGIPLLDAAAADAVKQWVYTPTLLNGIPVPVIMTVTVNFQLQ